MITQPSFPIRNILLSVLVFLLAACGGPDETVQSTRRNLEAGGEAPVIAELLSQLSLVEEKVLGLSDSFNQTEFDWRPSEGVRSGGEVFMHLTTINLVFPIFAGTEAPVSTGLTIENLDTAAPAFEGSLRARDDIVPELRRSFTHLRSAIESTSAQDLEDQVMLFGESTTVRAFWVDHVGHLREHLGQLIAYGRMNGVTPPWS